MEYDPSLGRQGNIEKALLQTKENKNNIETTENAACELDVNFDRRIADVENALCELDERGALNG